MKIKPHKACDCRGCKNGRGSKFGQFTHRAAERSFRQRARVQLKEITTGLRDVDSFDAYVNSTPFTD